MVPRHVELSRRIVTALVLFLFLESSADALEDCDPKNTKTLAGPNLSFNLDNLNITTHETQLKQEQLQLQMTAKINVRKSDARGHADHGWLNSYHTFSFAGYYDPEFDGYRSLRVINEDRVKPTRGFGMHPHRNFEIFSYVVSGMLAHQDNMGNKEFIKRGDVQFTSAGTGISHSEFNGSDKDWVHFLQIWVEPSASGLKPSYNTKHFSDEEKKNKLRLIVAPNSEEGSIKINQDSKVFASILEKNNKLAYKLPEARYGYLHLIQTGANSAIKINGVELKEGDGAFIEKAREELQIESTGEGNAEFLLFDLA
jgi:hypothetical protein